MNFVLTKIYNNIRFYYDYVNSWTLTFVQVSDNYEINQYLDAVNTIQYK